MTDDEFRLEQVRVCLVKAWIAVEEATAWADAIEGKVARDKAFDLIDNLNSN